MNGKCPLRRPERTMSWEDQLEVIRYGRYMTLAMCDGDKPYMVAMNYTFAESERCFYIHGAQEGRKADCLAANPNVFGMIVEDNRYVAGKTTYAYRSVSFEGLAEKVTDTRTKKSALAEMTNHFELDHAAASAAIARLDDEGVLAQTNVIRIRVSQFVGKQNPAKRP